MTAKQKRNIGRGVREANRRKRLSAAMKASWTRRRTENAPEVRNSNHITPERFQSDVEDNLVSQIIDLIDENARYRALLDKLHNALSK